MTKLNTFDIETSALFFLQKYFDRVCVVQQFVPLKCKQLSRSLGYARNQFSDLCFGILRNGNEATRSDSLPEHHLPLLIASLSVFLSLTSKTLSFHQI